MQSKQYIQVESMSYKEQRKGNELLIKFRIIYDVLSNNIPRTKTAKKYRMSRRSIQNLIKNFKEKIDIDTQIELLKPQNSLNKLDIEDKLHPLLNASTKPKTNKRSASLEQAQLIKKYFVTLKRSVGINRMWTYINRIRAGSDPPKAKDKKEFEVLKGITKGQLRGIYKREGLTPHKIRTKNGNVRPLYDYKALACFEYLHYDTKTILDQKALPEEIYNKFDLTKGIPIIEWNIIDVKSRFRFIAYSHNRTSDFGLHFLLLVIQFIRANTLNHDMQITIGTDGGSEFFSGSNRKKALWNADLDILNAKIYSYESARDVRKNLIERSHRTDDEEFFVPRGRFINDKNSFLKEASEYTYYFNAQRPHSGIEMNGLTPLEKLKESGLYKADNFLNFPTMILEESINIIRKSTAIIQFASEIKKQNNTSTPILANQKLCANLNDRFKKYSLGVQNVLTQYPRIL